MNKTIKLQHLLLACLTSTILFFSACNKNNEPIVAVQDIQQDVLEERLKCPKETVHINDLVSTLGTPSLERCWGQLNDVWVNCFNGGYLPEGCDVVEANTWISTSLLTDLITLDNPPFVSFAEQEEIIMIAMAIAQDEAPTCPLGRTANVVDLNFCKEPISAGINNISLTITATYCCGR